MRRSSWRRHLVSGFGCSILSVAVLSRRCVVRNVHIVFLIPGSTPVHVATARRMQGCTASSELPLGFDELVF